MFINKATLFSYLSMAIHCIGLTGQNGVIRNDSVFNPIYLQDLPVIMNKHTVIWNIQSFIIIIIIISCLF